MTFHDKLCRLSTNFSTLLHTCTMTGNELCIPRQEINPTYIFSFALVNELQLLLIKSFIYICLQNTCNLLHEKSETWSLLFFYWRTNDRNIKCLDIFFLFSRRIYLILTDVCSTSFPLRKKLKTTNAFNWNYFFVKTIL